MCSKLSSPHISVMLQEFLEFFSEKSLRVFFDGTIGAGGHAKALLEKHPEIELYIGCDRDATALQIASEQLKPWKEKVILKRGNFAGLDQFLKKLRVQHVDGFFLIWGCHLCN